MFPFGDIHQLALVDLAATGPRQLIHGQDHKRLAVIRQRRLDRSIREFDVDRPRRDERDEVTVVVRESLFSDDSRVEVWNRRTVETRILPVEEAKIYTPRWSPDGQYLAYASDLNGNKDLWILDTAIGETYQVTSGPEEDIFPSWSPDGQKLAYVSFEGGQSAVYSQGVYTGKRKSLPPLRALTAPLLGHPMALSWR